MGCPRPIGSTSLRQARVGRTTRRGSLTRLVPGCESLEGRRLLSAATVAILSAPPAAVADAAAILTGAAPTAFAQFQADLAQAEQRSHVTAAEANALAQDVSAIDQAISDAYLGPSVMSTAINDVQDWADNAFTSGPVGIRDPAGQVVSASQISERLQKVLVGVPAARAPLASATSPQDIHQKNGETTPLDQLIDQMKVVTRAARLTSSAQSALNRSYQEIAAVLAPDSDINLGPGATHSDPLVVYYNAQVANFVNS